MPLNIVKLAPNLAADVVVKYLDVVPSNQGYEDQLRVKGKIDGVEGVLYLPGSVADGLTELHRSGAINGIPSIPAPLPDKGFSIRTLNQHWRVTKQQPAGEKYGRLAVQVLDGKDAVAPPHASAPPPPASAASNGPITQAPKKSLAQMYVESTDFVLTTILPKLEAKGIGASDISVASMIATVFIARTRET